MDWIAIIQIVLSVLLVVLILMQRNDASVGSAFGSAEGGPERTRRGAERAIFLFTIVIAIAFVLLSLISLLK